MQLTNYWDILHCLSNRVWKSDVKYILNSTRQFGEDMFQLFSNWSQLYWDQYRPVYSLYFLIMDSVETALTLLLPWPFQEEELEPHTLSQNTSLLP